MFFFFSNFWAVGIYILINNIKKANKVKYIKKTILGHISLELSFSFFCISLFKLLRLFLYAFGSFSYFFTILIILIKFFNFRLYIINFSKYLSLLFFSFALWYLFQRFSLIPFNSLNSLELFLAKLSKSSFVTIFFSCINLTCCEVCSNL